MSEDDGEYEWPSDNGEDEELDDGEVEVSNLFYSAENDLRANPTEALE